MYAIVQVGGRQYRVAAGQRLVVDRMEVEAGSQLRLADVRMLVAEDGDPGETLIGRPTLEDVTVSATAVAHMRGRKLLIFKYKPKKRYRRHRGFRAELTELHVDEVRLGSAPEPSDSAATPAEAGEQPATASRATPTRAHGPARADGTKTATPTTASPKTKASAASASDEAKPAAGSGSEPEAGASSSGPNAAVETEAAAPKPTRTRSKTTKEQTDGS